MKKKGSALHFYHFSERYFLVNYSIK